MGGIAKWRSIGQQKWKPEDLEKKEEVSATPNERILGGISAERKESGKEKKDTNRTESKKNQKPQAEEKGNEIFPGKEEGGEKKNKAT